MILLPGWALSVCVLAAVRLVGGRQGMTSSTCVWCCVSWVMCVVGTNFVCVYQVHVCVVRSICVSMCHPCTALGLSSIRGLGVAWVYWLLGFLRTSLLADAPLLSSDCRLMQSEGAKGQWATGDPQSHKHTHKLSQTRTYMHAQIHIHMQTSTHTHLVLTIRHTLTHTQTRTHTHTQAVPEITSELSGPSATVEEWSTVYF